MKISKKTCQITFFALAPPKLKKSSLKKQYTFYNYSLKIFNYRLYHSKDSSCDFPEDLEKVEQLLTRADDLQSVRQRLSAEMADHSGIIRSLIVRAEDSRLMVDT